jgi:hypothetical protein
LPLALHLAARYLARHPGLTISSYMDKLSAALPHRSMDNWRAAEGSPTGHDLSLIATFAVSDRLIESDAAAGRLFALAGYCAPNTPIPTRLLQLAGKLEGKEYDEAVDTLVTVGLLALTPSTMLRASLPRRVRQGRALSPPYGTTWATI